MYSFCCNDLDGYDIIGPGGDYICTVQSQATAEGLIAHLNRE